jgi:hypothetical protein
MKAQLQGQLAPLLAGSYDIAVGTNRNLRFI